MYWLFESGRGLTAIALLLTYVGLCAWAWRRAALAASAGPLPGEAGWTVVYASQTGTARALAESSARAFDRVGAVVRCLPLDQLGLESLLRGGRYLFVISTAGDGDAPDNGTIFSEALLDQCCDLRGVEFALLALGDSNYRSYCGFARRLERWLIDQGARRRFAGIDVDRGDPQAIASWRSRLAELGAAEEFELAEVGGFSPWKLVDRQHLNAGSAGGEVYQLAFEPIGARLPDWSAGDLAQICLPSGDQPPRDYSIASTPEEGGRLHLLVRCHRRGDGSLGAMSGWLTGQLEVGGEVSLRLRQHTSFRLNDNLRRPIIFIGNGVGLAGLRAHLATRVAAGIRDNWLVFGERNAASDFHWGREIRRWHAEGFLAQLDPVFSRDPGDGRYVQDCLAANGKAFCEWIAQGAAVYVCGSRQGMAEAVENTIRDLLGSDVFGRLRLDGRYCRDVF